MPKERSTGGWSGWDAASAVPPWPMRHLTIAKVSSSREFTPSAISALSGPHEQYVCRIQGQRESHSALSCFEGNGPLPDAFYALNREGSPHRKLQRIDLLTGPVEERHG